jgi:hypothetical protein
MSCSQRPSSQEVALRDILPKLKVAAKDKVANVRFSVAKCFGDIVSAVDGGVVESEIRQGGY